MKRLTTPLAAAAIGAIGAIVGLAAEPLQASDAPSMTVFSVTEPIQVGDAKLSAGTYAIRVVSQTGLNVLQVTDRDLLTVHATFLAGRHSVPDSMVSSKGTLHFEDAPGETLVLRSWDLPNRSFGYDIVTSASRPAAVAMASAKEAGSALAAR